MTVPHFHTTDEVKAAIKRVEHNSDGGNSAPTGDGGGSLGNRVGGNYDKTSGGSKGADWICNRPAK